MRLKGDKNKPKQEKIAPSFIDVPNLDKVKKYNEYKEILDAAGALKFRLIIKNKDLTKIREKYVAYLKANPHKQAKINLETEVAKIQSDLIGIIPKKF